MNRNKTQTHLVLGTRNLQVLKPLHYCTEPSLVIAEQAISISWKPEIHHILLTDVKMIT